MKKTNLFLILSLLLVACSPKNQNSPSFSPQEQESVEYLASFLDTSFTLGDYGVVTTSTTKIFTFRNVGDTAGPATPTVTGTNASAFAIILQTGCSTVNVGSTCTIRVNFNPTSKPIGNYEATLTVGGTTKILSATIEASTNTGSGSVEATVSDVLIENPLDYGTLTRTQTITKTIKLTNKGTSVIGPHSATLSDTDFSFLINSCLNKVLAPNAFCSMRVSFNATGKTNPEYLTDLTFGSFTTGLKATIPSSSTGGTTGASSSSIVVLDGTNPAMVPMDYGSFSGRQSLIKIFTVKNTGTSSVVVNPTLNNTNFSMVLNGCSNKNLLPNGSCSIRVGFAASGKSAQEYLSTITILTGNTLELKATVTGSQGGTIEYTYSPVFSSFGICSALVCAGDGIQTRTLTQCNRFQDGTPAGVGTLANCSAHNIPVNTTQSCQSPQGNIQVTITGGEQTYSCPIGSTVQTFESVSCGIGFFIDGQICSANVIAYSPVYSDYSSCLNDLALPTEACDGIGSQSRTIDNCQEVVNGVPGAMVATNLCDSFNIPQNTSQSCLSPAGEKDILIDNGTQRVSCEEGSVFSQVISTSCDLNYHEENYLCVDDALTYHAIYSDYLPLQEDVEVCDGEVTATRTFTCHKDSDNSLVDNSFCPTDASPSITRLSPAGQTGLISINHGQKELGCAEGSSESALISITCDSGYFRGGDMCYKDPALLASDLAPLEGPYNTFNFLVPSGNYLFYGKNVATIPKKIVVSDGISILAENTVCPGTGYPQLYQAWGVDETGALAQSINCSGSRKRALYITKGTTTISTPEISLGGYNHLKSPLKSGFIVSLYNGSTGSGYYTTGTSFSAPDAIPIYNFNNTVNSTPLIQTIASLPDNNYLMIAHDPTYGPEPYIYNPLLPVSAINPIMIMDTTPGAGGMINYVSLSSDYRGEMKKSDDGTIIVFDGIVESTLATFILVYDYTQSISATNPRKINCTTLAVNNQNYGGCTIDKVINNRYVLYRDGTTGTGGTQTLYMYDPKTPEQAPVAIYSGSANHFQAVFLGDYNGFEYFFTGVNEPWPGDSLGYGKTKVFKINLTAKTVHEVYTVPMQYYLGAGADWSNYSLRPTVGTKAYLMYQFYEASPPYGTSSNLAYFDFETETITQVTDGTTRYYQQFLLTYDQNGKKVMYLSFYDLINSVTSYGMAVSDGTDSGTVSIVSGLINFSFTSYSQSPYALIKVDGWGLDSNGRSPGVFKINNRVIYSIDTNIYSIDINPP